MLNYLGSHRLIKYPLLKDSDLDLLDIKAYKDSGVISGRHKGSDITDSPIFGAVRAAKQYKISSRLRP